MSLYKDASLVMIPTAYKDGKLYSIRPTDGSGDFTFSRGSNLAATRVDVNGLIEKGRENRLLQSNQFDTTWSLTTAISVTSGQADKDGGTNAWLLKRADGSARFIKQTISQSGVQSFSVYIKAESTEWVYLFLGGTTSWAYFDLGSGSVGLTNSLIDSSIEAAGNGFYRCTITASALTSEVRIYPAQGNGAVSGDSDNGVYIQDAQLEAGLVATDYIETGASTAQAGILEDMPRLDYSGGASCPALLLEPQRTNLVTHSEYALDSSWTTQLGTLTANATTSPEGVDNAVKFLETAAGGRHRSFTSHNTNAGTYCVSVFMKDGNRGYGFLHWAMEGGDGRFSIVVDLSDGQVVDTMNFSGAEVIVDYGTEDYGNGWYRAYIVGTKASSNVSYVNFGLASSDNDTNSSGTPSYTGDGTHYAYFYGMQTEAGSYPTSYIPTYGSSVTRSLDSCLATSVSDLIGQTQGTFYWEGALEENPSGANMQFSLSDGTTSQQIKFVVSSSSTYVAAEVKNGGVQQFYNNHNIDAKANRKYAIAYKANDFAFYIDGTQIATDTSGSIPACTKISFDNGVGANNIHGVFNNVILFPTRLTNDELASLTTL